MRHKHVAHLKENMLKLKRQKHIRWLYIYEDDLQFGKLKENCLLLKLYRKLRKMFLSPRRESNPQPSDLRWDALTIELPGLRWQREGHDVYRFVCATHVLLIQMYVYDGYWCCSELHIYLERELSKDWRPCFGPWRTWVTPVSYVICKQNAKPRAMIEV